MTHLHRIRSGYHVDTNRITSAYVSRPGGMRKGWSSVFELLNDTRIIVEAVEAHTPGKAGRWWAMVIEQWRRT